MKFKLVFSDHQYSWVYEHEQMNSELSNALLQTHVLPVQHLRRGALHPQIDSCWAASLPSIIS